MTEINHARERERERESIEDESWNNNQHIV